MEGLERKWWTLIAVCTAIFMLLLDITVVNVALPDMQRDLDASFAQLQWVVDAYALTLATTVLAAGSLADIFGRRRVFTMGLVLFTAASFACGIANDAGLLIAARAVQGVGGGIMFAVSLALLANAFQGRDRGTAFGSGVPRQAPPWRSGRSSAASSPSGRAGAGSSSSTSRSVSPRSS